MITLIVCSVAAALASHENPKTLRSYATPGTASVSVGAIPVERTLTRAELEQWTSRLGATPAQATIIQARFDEFVIEHDAMMDRLVPPFLAAGASLSAAMEQYGYGSSEFVAAEGDLYRRLRGLMDEAERLELRFIEICAQSLNAEQQKWVTRLRAAASRRKSLSVPAYSRWLTIDLCPIAEQAREALSDARQREAFEALLDAYDLERSQLLARWSKVWLDGAARLSQEFSSRIAEGRGDDEPHPVWAARLRAVKSIRALHLRTVEALGNALPPTETAKLKQRVREALYPELYPDPDAAFAVLTAVASDEGLPADLRASVHGVIAGLEQEYAKECAKLESYCDAWEDELEGGSTAVTPQGLPHALKPLLAERKRISRDALRSCEELVGKELLSKYSDGRTRASDAAGP